MTPVAECWPVLSKATAFGQRCESLAPASGQSRVSWSSSAMKCPHCQKEINVGALLGSATSKAKARAARRNAKLGGWPKGKKRGPRKLDANFHAMTSTEQTSVPTKNRVRLDLAA